MFIYDTRKDSDGGAWRKRTQHTSWYNEALNTATRGSRKEFPAVAVIVAEVNDVTIYDGDDPDLPMWMVFTGSGGPRAVRQGVSSVSAFNGVFLNGRSGSERALGYVSFIHDDFYQFSNGGLTRFNQTGLVNRNTDGSGYTVTDSSMAIVNNTVNDVAMTVLPNAPIDAATGLPVPTIAVATDGGVSVIKDDGTVVDWYRSSGTEYSHQVAFDENDSLYVTWGTNNGQERHLSYLDVIPSSDDTQMTNDYYNSYDGVGSQAFGSSGQGILSNNARAFAAKTGRQRLFLLDHNRTNTDNSSVCDITSTYNTGWMNGDIKLATLSDTDDTNITFADKQLIDEPYFNASTGWYFNGSGASGAGASSGNGWTIAGGKITQSGTGGDIYAVIPVVNGKQYVMQLTFDTTGTSSFSNVSWGFRSLANGGYLSTIQTHANLVGNTANQTEQVFWTADTTGNIIARVYSGEALSIDNFTVHIAEPDRSVNGNGLQVVGTVTKTAVATGADLVAYSGFSTSNYLAQPYNADLQFGTGDFVIMSWIKKTSGSTPGVIVDTRSAASSNAGLSVEVLSNQTLRLRAKNSSSEALTATTVAVSTNTWTHFACVVSASGTSHKIYLNGKLDVSASVAAYSVNSSNPLWIGGAIGYSDVPLSDGSLALFRISATAPSAEQIKKIYNDEKFLFQENAKATLYGTSDAVTALAYDDDTELLHAGTSAGRSVFQGLRRIDNTTDAVGAAISASNGMVAED